MTALRNLHVIWRNDQKLWMRQITFLPARYMQRSSASRRLGMWNETSERTKVTQRSMGGSTRFSGGRRRHTVLEERKHRGMRGTDGRTRTRKVASPKAITCEAIGKREQNTRSVA